MQLPELSVEGRPIHVLRLRAGDGGNRRGVLLVGGTHARELMNPDAILELAVDLFVSYATGSDVVYGGRTWTAGEIRLVLEALDLWMLPCGNPDGRDYVMTVDDLWRKNRRDNPGTSCDGVDLNRNLDVVWGITEGQTSCSPCSDVYCGPAAFSEPETRNIKHLLDTQRIVGFVDVHSYSELVLHPWGHAPTQTNDLTKRFTGLASGTCAPINQAGYQEYITPRDLLRFQTVGQRVVDAIAAVRGRQYTNQPGVGLYPTTGTHSDYVYSRHIADPSLTKTYSYTFETGPWTGDTRDSFHPADPTLIKRDAKAGMLTFAQQCVCAIELIGTQVLGRTTELQALQGIRENLLATTDAGLEWITLTERLSAPIAAAVLHDERLAQEAAHLLERADEVIRDTSQAVTDDDVEQGTSLIEQLCDPTMPDEVRADLETVTALLTELSGFTAQRGIEMLMQRKPSRHDRIGEATGDGR
jgi:murein tripeptide amidase MpaA